VFEVVVPKLNNNDESYALVEWLVRDGQRVGAGDPLVELETSKAAAELEAGEEGFVLLLAEAKTDCRAGEVIARLFATEDDWRRARTDPAPAAAPRNGASGPLVTAAAKARAEQLGVSPERLRALGGKVVKSEDVERLVAEPTGSRPLSRTQQAIAAVVTESHRTIPAAHAVIRVQVDEALLVAKQEGKRAGTLIGLPELLVRVLAGLRDRFELFFAAPDGNGGVRLADGAHIGVTVDVGTGLYVPVIRDAERLSLVQIADALEDVRTRAGYRAFHEADFTGMNLMLSLHNDPDLVLALPVVHPGTTCVICLACVQRELTMDEHGRVVEQRVVNISATYDHRTVNGRDAVQFLQAVKTALEYPEPQS
jgi:2-oxoglutarate dehydrogenase E2 component (dihydrolipoamide succinyltransferase)